MKKAIIGILVLVAIAIGGYYLYSTGEWKQVEITGGGEVPLVELMADDKQDIRQMLLDGKFESVIKGTVVTKTIDLTIPERKSVQEYLIDYISESELPADDDICGIRRYVAATFLLPAISIGLSDPDPEILSGMQSKLFEISKSPNVSSIEELIEIMMLRLGALGVSPDEFGIPEDECDL